jgi:GTP-binding protein
MFVPRGGPDGGDGGNGGDVVFTASHRLTTLLDLRYQRHYEAEDGRHGGGSNCTGRTGKDVIVTLPVGTVVYDDATGEVLADLVTDGETAVIAHGGRGGRGNSHFATSTNRVPTRFDHGTEGEERQLRLELKLLADVGLVGFPNAGKSTLIAAISAARPKIADYPFTTLIPNLGVVRWGSHRSFVVADIPGLIEGAHEGRGLGFQFLRHIERTAFLLHLIDVSEWATEEPVVSFDIMRQELAAYDETLNSRPFAVVATKVDISGKSDRLKQLQTYCRRHKYKCFPVSAATREGLDELVAFVGKQVDSLRKTPCETRS